MTNLRKSISTAIVVFNTFIILLGITVSCVFFYFKSEKLSNEINSLEVQERKEIIRNTYVDIILHKDLSKIQEMSEAFFLSENGLLLALRVVDAKGKLLADQIHKKYNREYGFDKVAAMAGSERHSVVINKKGEKIGTVDFVATSSSLILHLEELMYYFIFVFIGTFVLVSVFFYWFLNKNLSQPLKYIAEEARRIQFGDYGFHISEDFYGELSAVSMALNTAVRQINLRDQKLINYSENLKKMVEKQSIELDEQRAININSSRMATIGELSAVIAHEVNNPLTIIEVQVFKMSRFLKELSRRNKDLIQHELEINKILEMTSRISRIVKSLNVISRDGRSDPFKPFCLIALLENIQLLTDFRVKSMGAELKIEYPEEIPVCFGREVQISQALLNLINNSVDAIAHIHKKWILVQVVDEKSRVVFKVTDSGEGIPSELAAKIMQPFFTTKSVGRGTGLGLGIVSSIVQEHHGDFFYNSGSSNTQFVFSLPKQNS